MLYVLVLIYHDVIDEEAYDKKRVMNFHRMIEIVMKKIIGRTQHHVDWFLALQFPVKYCINLLVFRKCAISKIVQKIKDEGK